MWGMTLAHLGIAVFLIGALLVKALSAAARGRGEAGQTR
jgi:cytochrome c biogenesis factor